MELYILRHGIATQRQTHHTRRDALRPLTDRGVRKLHRVGRYLHVMEVTLDLTLTSPLVRARQTAEIIAGDLACPTVEETSFLEPGGNLEKLCALMARRARAARRVMLVGHEPALSTLCSVLLTGEDGLQMVMKKGGLCKLRVDRMTYGRCATLQWLISPGLLAGMR